MNLLDSLWHLTVVVSIRAGLLILAVLVLRGVLRERVPAQCFHLLWLLVALRLLLPVAPSSAWSVFNLFSKPETADYVNAAPWQVRLSVEKPAAESASADAAKPEAVLLSKREIGSRQIVPLVWMLGVVVQAVLLTHSVVRVRRRLRGAPAVCDLRLDALLAECASRAGVSGALRVIETDMVSGPAVVGFWRPRLLFPPGLMARLSDEELRIVLLHECAHLRRRDVPALWALTAARVLHWFNPLVWIAAHAARVDAELACDETVLREAKPEQTLAYGEAILRLAQMVAWRPLAFPAAGVVESKRALRTRLARIARFNGKARHRGWLSALIVISAGICFGAEEKVPTPASVEAPPEAAAASATELAEWARGWSVVWVSFPPQGSDSKPQVDLQKPDGAGVSLAVGAQSDEGVKLVGVDWVNSPKATAVIMLEKAGERALLYASSEVVSRRGDERPTRPQIEIQARFFEISETNARRLGGRNFTGSRDAIGIEVLGARMSGGSPAVQLLTEVQGQEFLRELNQTKGVDVLSTPGVITKSGQRAIIEIVREFRYPIAWDATPEVRGGWNPKSFETRSCGVTLEVEPAINEAGAIVMKLCPQVVEFLGFRDIDSGKKYPVSSMASKSFVERSSIGSGATSWKQPGARIQPVFSDRKIATELTLLPGYSILIVGIGETENAEGFPSRAKSHRLAVLIRGTVINAPNQPSRERRQPSAPAPVPKDAEPRNGIPVPERPGFITSPFAPESGAIDVRGFPPGTQVRCPFSGKTILVP